MRPVHHLMIRSIDRERILVLEPSGMELPLAPHDQLLIESIGIVPPALEIERDRITCWSETGSEIRVLRGDEEIYSTVGNPVPGVPDGMSVQGFMEVLGLKDPRRN